MQRRVLVKPFALVFTLSSLVACAHSGFLDKVPQHRMGRRLEYQGFSFDRPSNLNWYLLKSESSHTKVLLRRHIWMAKDTHTFYALVKIGGIDSQPSSHAAFAEMAKYEEQYADYSIELENYQQSPTTRQNQWCIRFESSYKITHHPQFPEDELRMILRGYRCLHPAWPNRTLDFFYSERGLPDEIDPKLSSEGEAFLERVRIDVGPGSAAF